MNATKNNRAIHIYADHVWAGSGVLNVDGIIEDCAAILGGDQDTAETIYEQIEECIESDCEDYTHDGVVYTWTISAAE